MEKAEKRYIILKDMVFIPKVLKQYNNKRVKVKVIKEKYKGCFHVIFPCGYRTDYEGDNHHLIIAWERPDSDTYIPLWEECSE